MLYELFLFILFYKFFYAYKSNQEFAVEVSSLKKKQLLVSIAQKLFNQTQSRNKIKRKQVVYLLLSVCTENVTTLKNSEVSIVCCLAGWLTVRWLGNAIKYSKKLNVNQIQQFEKPCLSVPLNQPATMENDDSNKLIIFDIPTNKQLNI